VTDGLKGLIENNKNCAECIKTTNSRCYKKLAEQQESEYLWIACVYGGVFINEFFRVVNE